MFVIFHTLGGIGIGLSSVAAPAYIAEISPPRFRGRLGSLQQLAIVCGIFGSLALTWLPFHLAGGSNGQLWLGLAAWRWTYLSEVVPALVYFALIFTIPESPRYLVARQQISQARRVLSKLLGDRDVEPTINRITDTLEQEKPPSWRDLRKPTGGLYSIVWVGLGLAVVHHCAGDHWGQCRDHVGGDRADRPARPQAAVVGRIGGHGIDAGDVDRRFRQRIRHRWSAGPQRGVRADRAGRR
jgi:MFS family permease